MTVDLKLSFLKPIHATWLAEMKNFLYPFIQVKDLLHNLGKEIDGSHSKTRNFMLSDSKHKIFTKSRNSSVAKYTNLKIAKLNVSRNNKVDKVDKSTYSPCLSVQRQFNKNVTRIEKINLLRQGERKKRLRYR